MNRRQRKKYLKSQGKYVSLNECWNLDETLAKFILPRLQCFKNNSTTYPGREEMDTPEKWDVALDKMIEAFKLVIEFGENDDKYFTIENNGKYIFLADKLDADHKKIEEGLQLFAKWFLYLGW